MRRAMVALGCGVGLALVVVGCSKHKQDNSDPSAEFGEMRLEEPLPPVLTIPLGVADTANDVGYVENTSGGIDAISLESGALLWSTDAAAHPLWLRGSRLVARPAGEKNQLQLVVLDVGNKGAVLLRPKPLTLPEWASIKPVMGRGRSFSCRGRFEDDRHFVVAWEAGSYPLGEMPNDTRKPRQASGFARFDLDSGKVQDVAAEAAPRELAPRLPESLDKVFSGPPLTGLSVRLWDMNVEQMDGTHKRPALVGDHLVYLERTKGDGRLMLWLHTYDAATGKAAEPRLLRQTLPFDPEANPSTSKWRPGEISPDWHVDATVWTETGLILVNGYPLPEAPPRNTSEVYSANTGERLRRVTIPEGQEYTLVGHRGYMVVHGGRDVRTEWDHKYARSLRAVEAASGKALWERPVAEYHRLFAPRWYSSPD